MTAVLKLLSKFTLGSISWDQAVAKERGYFLCSRKQLVLVGLHPHFY